ncbi:MAG: TrkA C-terminal domain-containing protein [Cyanobacteria bacterium J06634_5]
MGALISVLVTITLSLLITRVATEAMVLTGLSQQAAQFQARSAFTGAGFTTQESEQAINHPVRRQIIMWLMLLGNAGIVTVVSSLVLTFVSTTGYRQTAVRAVVLGAGLLILWGIATDRRFDQFLTRFMQWALQRWTTLDVRDYTALLRLTGEYTVSELQVEKDTWLANEPLSKLQLNAEGVVVLGIQRSNGFYVGAPQPSTQVLPEDSLLLYGREQTIVDLDKRLKGSLGEKSHQQAVVEQQALIKHEALTDAVSASSTQLKV